MKENRIEFISGDGTSLQGILAEPNGPSKGAVVLAHGITVEKNEGGFYTRLAETLASNSLQSLRFDFRGHGESGGKPQDVTIQGEVDDLTAAVNILRERGFQRVAIVGTSFGAGIAVFYSERRPETVCSLTLLAPVLDYNRTFLIPETEWAQEWFSEEALENAERKGTLDLDGFLLGRQLLTEFKTLRPGEVLLTLNAPTLVVHGTDDSMVPYNAARHFGSKYRHGQFLPIEGADHGFEGFEESVFSEVCKWILQHLED